MKIKENFTFPTFEELSAFITTHKYSKITVEFDGSTSTYNVTTESDTTEAEFNIGNLSYIAKEHDLTMEQRNAIDYGISAIKTLIDMGILK